MDYQVIKGHCSICDAPLLENSTYAKIGKINVCALCAMTTTVNNLVNLDPELIAVEESPDDSIIVVE